VLTLVNQADSPQQIVRLPIYKYLDPDLPWPQLMSSGAKVNAEQGCRDEAFAAFIVDSSHHPMGTTCYLLPFSLL